MEKTPTPLPIEFQSVKDSVEFAFMTDGLDGANKVIEGLEAEAAAAEEFSKIENALERGELIIRDWDIDATDIEAVVRDRDLARNRLEFAKNALLIARIRETLE